MKKISGLWMLCFLVGSAHAVVTHTIKTKSVKDASQKRTCILLPNKNCAEQVFEAKDGFPRQQIEGMNFSGSHFKGTAIQQFDLDGIYGVKIDFSSTTMTYVALSGSELHDADFHLATITDGHLSGIRGEKINFKGATLDKVYLDDAAIDQADFRDSILRTVYMNDSTTAQNADFSRAIIDTLEAKRIRAEHSEFDHTVIKGNSTFEDAKLQGAQFNCAFIGKDVSFKNANLKEAGFKAVYFEGELSDHFDSAFVRSSSQSLCFSSSLENGVRQTMQCRGQAPNCCQGVGEKLCQAMTDVCKWESSTSTCVKKS